MPSMLLVGHTLMLLLLLITFQLPSRAILWCPEVTLCLFQCSSPTRLPHLTKGTSCSAPEFGGIISQLNDIRLNKGLPVLGALNTRLYQTASKHTLFYDMTQGMQCSSYPGNSKCAINDCCATGFPAEVGWDAITGWGSPQWPGLVQYLTNDN